jgi:hypothetical protein
MSLPSSGYKNNEARNRRENIGKQSWFLAGLPFTNLKMKETCSSVMSVGFQSTAWRYAPEDREFFITSSVRISNPESNMLLQ